jgi:hypothetical protein
MYYTYPMLRIQLHLTARHAALLAQLAKRRGTTRAELIRRGVDLVLREESQADDPLLELIGAAQGVERSDISERHDDLLYVRDSVRTPRRRSSVRK